MDTPAEEKPILLELLEYRGMLEREILSYEKIPPVVPAKH